MTLQQASGNPTSQFFVRRNPSFAPFVLKPAARLKQARQLKFQKEGPDMRVHPVAMSLAIATLSGNAVQNPAFAEEYRGTFAQQLACTPDVFRLCGDQIPDTNRIVACLRQNTALLSGDCRAVFESNASASPEAAPGRGNDRPRSYSGQ
jgi:hypothetical protein